MPNDADGPIDLSQVQPRAEGTECDETPPSDESISVVDLREFRALLADLSREFAAGDAELLRQAVEPIPSHEPLRANAQRTAATAYAAAAVPMPEHATASTSTSFALVLEDRLKQVEALAAPAAIAQRTPSEEAPSRPDSAFGQRFRARRRTLGRGCAVR